MSAAAPSWEAGKSSATVDVAVHAPTGRDGPLTVSILEHWGVTARLCPDIATLCDAIGEDVGVLVIAEEALSPDAREALLRALSRQPSWSDIPLIILTGEGELSRSITAGIEAVTTRGNAILLERPIRIATLVTALRSALRARLRLVPAATYGVLLSLEPAVAALVGLTVLGQGLSAVDVVAIGCVVAASAGASRVKR